jgi:hypothetical protein
MLLGGSCSLRGAGKTLTQRQTNSQIGCSGVESAIRRVVGPAWMPADTTASSTSGPSVGARELASSLEESYARVDSLPTRRLVLPRIVRVRTGWRRLGGARRSVLVFCLVRVAHARRTVCTVLHTEGPVAQWKSVRFTRGRSLVRSQPGPHSRQPVLPIWWERPRCPRAHR